MAQASATAGKILALFAREEVEGEPTVARVNESICIGCLDCQRVCPAKAIERKEIRDRRGNLVKAVSWVNPGLCAGCGACVVTCRNHSLDLEGFSDEQVYAPLSTLAAA